MSSTAFISPREMSRRAGCTLQAIYQIIKSDRLRAMKVEGRWQIAESAATAFIEAWPTSNRGVSNRWALYREYMRSQAVVQPEQAAS